MKQTKQKQQAIDKQTANSRSTTTTAKRLSSYALPRPENFPKFSGCKKFSIEVLFPNGKEGTQFFEGTEQECLDALISCICDVFGAEQSVSVDFCEMSDEEFSVTLRTDDAAEQRGDSLIEATPAPSPRSSHRPLLISPILVVGAIPAHDRNLSRREGL